MCYFSDWTFDEIAARGREVETPTKFSIEGDEFLVLLNGKTGEPYLAYSPMAFEAYAPTATRWARVPRAELLRMDVHESWLNEIADEARTASAQHQAHNEEPANAG